MNYVFSPRSLEHIVRAARDDWFEDLGLFRAGQGEVVSHETEDFRFFVAADDPEDSRIILALGDAAASGWGFERIPVAARREALRRLHVVAIKAAHPPLRLPRQWTEYHSGNRLAFFACPIFHNSASLRWIAESSILGSNNLAFWRVTDVSTELALDAYVPPYQLYERAVALWPEAVSGVRSQLAEIGPPPATVALQETVDLDAVSFGPVTQHRQYSSWWPYLTQKQREFVSSSTEYAMKLRGPAGTGKTLALELKALHELYEGRRGPDRQSILFVTQSWAMAFQIDEALHELDESGDLGEIVVCPLLAIAEDSRYLPQDGAAERIGILGEDSYDGKLRQLEMIDEIIDQLLRGDWLTYKSMVSGRMRSAVEAGARASKRKALVWDLMNEFSCVLSAKGILPGLTSEQKYLALPRSKWMMTLDEQGDRRFVFRVYTDYVGDLRRRNVLGSDQVVADLLKYLGTFAWNIRRQTYGHDLILVDELHLFNEQERLVLHYLTRSAEAYPRILMALDPRQSPSEVFIGEVLPRVTAEASGAADEELVKLKTVDLHEVHRFSPEILRLVQHIHRQFPALELGQDWELDANSLTTSALPGPVPLLVTHATAEAEREAVVKRAERFAKEASRNERVAIVVVDSMDLSAFEEAARREGGKVTLLKARDDVYSLAYTRRTVVLTAAEYVSGLQFERVLVAGLGGRPIEEGYELRRLLSLLYLAISRATRFLEIHVHESAGAMPPVLETARKSGFLSTSA